MQIETLEKNQIPIAVVYSEEAVITDVQSALDFIMQIKYETGAQRVVINKKALCGEFFILSTKLAGEILQKYIHYHVKLAVYGDFSHYTSKPLKDFFYESNQGKDFFFTATREQAIEKLTSAGKRA